MPNSFPSQHSFKSWWQGLALGALTLLVALPWIRNHNRLRDFMDYGAGDGRRGSHGPWRIPFRDFTTPIQAGFLQLNRWAERMGAGDDLRGAGANYGFIFDPDLAPQPTAGSALSAVLGGHPLHCNGLPACHHLAQSTRGDFAWRFSRPPARGRRGDRADKSGHSPTLVAMAMSRGLHA